MKCKYKKFLKAAYINYDEDYCSYGSSTFTKPTITTPIIVIMGTTAIIACAISGVTIYYTLDGSTPTSSSTLYTGAITLTLSCVIKAIAVKPGMTDSEVASENYVHYLTAWRLVGNSTVHTDEYLTQWKVEGNSVVDNNAILSCGDYSDVDGKYHVKISNGVTIYDIPLDEPLRKVNDVADNIEFADGVVTLIRNIGSVLIKNTTVVRSSTNTSNVVRWRLKVGAKGSTTNILNTKYPLSNRTYYCEEGMNADSGGDVQIFDNAYTSAADLEAFIAANADVEIIYELATPITETIQVSPFPVSATDTYTSVNDTPYSAFEYKKNVEIWSCGEYNATDGKYHIRILPEGYGVVDIALDEPLRMISDAADTIEFADGVGTLTRSTKSVKWSDIGIAYHEGYKRFYSTSTPDGIFIPTDNISRLTTCLSGDFIQSMAPLSVNDTDMCMIAYSSDSSTVRLYIRDLSIDTPNAFQSKYGSHELLYRLETPTTETIQVPQIQEAENYTCIISQGAKAVSWSSFETE